MSVGALRWTSLPGKLSTSSPRPGVLHTDYVRLFVRLSAPRVRHLHATRPQQSQQSYAAVVAGSGPAGLAVVGNLLESRAARAGKVLWVDPDWQSGRLGDKWREVPRNTKAKLFVQFAEGTGAFRRVIDETPAPNGVVALKALEQEKGCQISYAADMCAMLSDGVVKQSEVDKMQGMVTGADWNDESCSWTVQVKAPNSTSLNTVATNRLVLCTGAAPTGIPLPVPGLQITEIELETMFQPTELVKIIPHATSTTIAVIGASHSPILVLLNLFYLAQRSHPHLSVRWFTRNKLRYAIFKDDKIYYDNTGLKGQAAEFAKEQLEDDKLSTSPAGKVITKIDGSQDEHAAYKHHLPGCTHVVHAVGFTTNPLPKLTRNGKVLGTPTYDHLNGGFVDAQGKIIPALFGAGIAFPERVTDPAGHQELSVGLWKFMTYLKRVVPAWLHEAEMEPEEQKASAA